jgi:hypothetical protein
MNAVAAHDPVEAQRRPATATTGPSCAVCDHEVDQHDSISRRYCQATQAHALPRGCICPGQSR